MIDKEINSLKLLKKELKGAFQVKVSSTIPDNLTLITVWETPDSEVKYILTHNKVSNVISVVDINTFLIYNEEETSMMFDEKSMKLIKEGKKTETRRVVRSDIRPAVPGHIHKIKVDRTSNTYGYIHIKKVKQEKWGMMNEWRARYEGFDDVEEYKEYFYSINGKIDNDDLVWVIEFKYIGDKMIEEITIPRKQYCLKCDECDFNINSGLRDHICFSYEFWHDDVLANKEHHFVDAEGHVYSMTSKENGGFGRQGYDVELRDGTKFENIGLWHRGEAPSSVRKQLIRGERTPVYRR